MKVLLPLDGSKLSQIVYPWAKLLGSEFELLRSYLPLDQTHLAAGITVAVSDLANNHTLEEKIQNYLKEQAAQFDESPVKTTCLAGQAADVILDRSEDNDLIIMASHGESGITRWLLGSVTTKVVRAGNKPVLVVSAQPDPQPQEAKLDTILVPLDGSETAERALVMATELARKHNSKLVLYEGVLYRHATPEAEDWQALSAQEYLAKKVEELSDVQAEYIVHETTTGIGITERAEKVGADLIVMGSHGRSGVSRLMLGSITEGVVQKSVCPVLVVYGRE